MKRKPRTPRARTQRRLDQRAATALANDREHLFQLETGGTPQRPIDVPSASVIETHALAIPCPRCQGTHDLLEHAAITIQGTRLRETRLACRQCATRRSLYFRIRDDRPN